MIATISSYYVRPEQLKEMEMDMEGHNADLLSTDGCVSLVNLRSQSDPLKFTRLTCWESKEKFMAHFYGAEHVKSQAVVDKFWSKPPEVEFYDVLP